MPSYLGGYLETAVSEVRDHLGEPVNSTRLPTGTILRRIPDVYCQVFRDMQRESEKSIVMSYSWALSGLSVDEHFLLPATCGAIKAVEYLNSDGAVIQREVRRRPRDESKYNYGFDLLGPYLRLVRAVADNSTYATLRILYEPGAYAPVHYGSMAAGQMDSAASPQTVQPNQASSQIGQLDYRRNAYIGMWFRVYGTTSAPTGYTNTTANEFAIPISNFAPTTQKCSLLLTMPFTTGHAWSYEILPSIDATMWRAVAYGLARKIANTWKRVKLAQALNAEYQDMVRSMMLTEGQADVVTMPMFERGERQRVYGPWRSGYRWPVL